MTDLEREFPAYAVEQAHPFVHECAGATLTDNVLKALRTDIERIASAEFAQWHGHGREELGVPISAFNNRLMELGSLRLIAGIRFRNRDTVSMPMRRTAERAGRRDVGAAYRVDV